MILCDVCHKKFEDKKKEVKLLEEEFKKAGFTKKHFEYLKFPTWTTTSKKPIRNLLIDYIKLHNG